MWPASVCAGVPAPPGPSSPAWAGVAKNRVFVNSQNPNSYGKRQCVQLRRPLSVNSPEAVFQTITKIIIGYVLTVQNYKLAKLSRKEVPNHRQAKQQARNQDGTHPGFLAASNRSGVVSVIPGKRTLFAGRKTESPDRPGNPAAEAVRIIPALSGKSAGYPGRFGV